MILCLCPPDGERHIDETCPEKEYVFLRRHNGYRHFEDKANLFLINLKIERLCINFAVRFENIIRYNININESCEMNISLQNTDKVNAVLTVKLEKADYEERVEKALKSLRHRINMPGFRPGMVPVGLVKKQYGKSVLAEELNKLLQEKIYEYIRENNINMLGEPLPNEEQQKELDFEHGEEFEFVFDVALAPEFKVELGKDDKVPFYDIEVSDEMIDRQVSMYKQRAGKYEKVDAYQEKDMIKGAVAELDENGNVKEGGVQAEGVILMPTYFKNDDQKKIFENAKVNDVLIFNPSEAYAGNETEMAALLKVKKEEVKELKSDFSFQIEEITRFVEGELTQEIFDQVFGKDVVHNEEEFRTKTRESIQSQLVNDSDFKFLVDARDLITGKIGKLEFPDALLKKIMRANNPDKDEKFVEDNYDRSIKELTWHLVKEQLVKEYDIKVDDKDMLEQAKAATRAQFAQYGMVNLPEDVVDNYAKEMLKKKESVQSLVDRCIENKIALALKDKVTLEHKSISMEEFTKMFNEE